MNARIGLLIAALAAAGCAPSIAWRLPAPDHRAWVTARSRGHATCITFADRDEDCWDAVALRALVFSADGRHLAYPARMQTRWRIVRDGIWGVECEAVGVPVFSPDGDHLAYAAKRRGDWCVVLDGLPGAAFDSVIAGTVAFDASGQRLAYAAREPSGAQVVVGDGARLAPCEAIERVAFDPIGRLVVVTRDHGSTRLLVDGAEVASGDAIGALAFSSHGAVACAVRRGGAWWIRARGDDAGPFAAVRSLAYRSGDDSLVAGVSVPGGQRVRVGASEERLWSAIETPVFALNGRWGYAARDTQGTAVVLDGEVLTREGRASSLAFSDDGARWAYATQRGDQAYVVDEHGAHPFGLVLEGSLLFRDGGRRWACVAGDPRTRKLFVVVEGLAERRPFDWTAVTRLTRRELGEPDVIARSTESVRAWVAAEADRMIEAAR